MPKPGTTFLVVAALSMAAVLPGYTAAFLLLQRSGVRKPKEERRRYHGLRETTDRFLEEVRRLNTLRVAVETGERSPLEAAPEPDEVRRRMFELIAELHEAAAQVGPSPPAPEP